MNLIAKFIVRGFACLSLFACAPEKVISPVDVQLFDREMIASPLSHWLSRGKYTVVLFVSGTCPCVRAHAERIRTLSERFAPLGVTFIAVDPEVDATRVLADTLRKSNGWSFPVLLDRHGELATRLGAEYSSHVTLLDGDGRVYYEGGIDSDRKHLHADATPYLANALEDVTAGRVPRVARTEALGCVLRRN